MAGQHALSIRARLGLAAALVLAAPFVRAQQGADAALIPRQTLFGPAAKASPQLSPDGTRIAWLAPSGSGDSSIWVADTASQPLSGEPLTRDDHRGIYHYQWAMDGKHLLYWQDRDGDENWHLYSVDVATRKSRDLTPYPGASVQNLQLDPHQPHTVLVGLNKRDHQMFDAYRVDLDSGEASAEAQNPGDVLSWTADHHLSSRAATAFDPKSGATLLRVRDRPEDPWRDLLSWPFTDALMAGQINGGSVAAGFSPDDRALYVVSTSDSPTSRLLKVATRDAHTDVVAAADCDVAEDFELAGGPDDLRHLVLYDPETGAPEAVAFECFERSWHALNPRVEEDLKFLQAHTSGFPYVVNRTRQGDRWVVATLAGDRPVEYRLYDRKARSLQPLFSEHPDLSHFALATPEPIEIKARDGLRIPIYLTRPVHARGASPLVLLPHGGPWSRDHLDFDPIVQFFANRGYAVLQVEYRGSTGFGKAFLNAGNGQFGLKMRDDLIDAVEWTVQQKIADPKRIGVFGVSAGGYLSLRVTEARPDLFRATVDVVGPTDVKFLIDSMPPNWHAVKTRWLRRIGDVEHDAALNRALSPNFDGSHPQGAFLIAQGAHDPRVNRGHSDHIVAELRKQGAAVTYLVYTDEGHGFVRPENNLDFYGRVESFLAAALGGRVEPGTQQPGAHVEVQ